MMLQHEQVWRTRGGQRVSIYHVDHQSAAVGPCKGESARELDFLKSYHVDLSGRALGTTPSDYDLVEYRGYGIDLGEAEGRGMFIKFIEEQVEHLEKIYELSFDLSVSRFPEKIKKILDGYKDAMSIKYHQRVQHQK